MKITWKQCMELSSTISASILNSQDDELMKMTLGQLVKVKKIIEDEIKSYFDNSNENESK